MTGYIKLYRRMLDWEWYDDINTKCLFLHCLLRANHESTKWRGIEIKKGQFLTSYQHLAEECGLTVRQVRTSLERLKSTNELTHETTSQYSLISIKNWDKWQANDTQNDKRATSERQASDMRATTDNNDKNNKNDKNVINKDFINAEKIKKTDPFNNSFISEFKNASERILGSKPYLLTQQRNKIIELASEIENFKETIPIVLEKMKNIDFGFENWRPDVNWLLKDSNYTSILNGTYDKKDIWAELKEKERKKNGAT